MKIAGSLHKNQLTLITAIVKLVHDQISPMDFISIMEEYFISHCPFKKREALLETISKGIMNNTQRYTDLISLIPYKSLRVDTALALLRRYPNIRLRCCRQPLSFKCGFTSEKNPVNIGGGDVSTLTLLPVIETRNSVIREIVVLTSQPTRSLSGCSRTFNCSVCLSQCDRAERFMACVNTQCSRTVCKTCMLEYVDSLVESTRYSLPVITCVCCKSRIPTAWWKSELRIAGKGAEKHNAAIELIWTKYIKNDNNMRKMRCSECDGTHTLFSMNPHPENANRREILCKAIDEIAGGDQLLEIYLAKLLRDFTRATITPNAFIQGLEDFFLKCDSTESLKKRIAEGIMHHSSQFRRIIFAIADEERRGSAFNSLLLRYPKLKSRCGGEYCFTCKIASFHIGLTCTERLRREQNIEAQYCPSCRVPTVRSEGCSSILCVCGAHWNWKT